MTSEKYNVALLAPGGYSQALAFGEVAELLVASLGELGLEVKFAVNEVDPGAVNIILGYHLVQTPKKLAGVRYIVYQLEQMTAGSVLVGERQWETLRGAAEVWDYSEANVAALQARGIRNVRLVPPGFHGKLERIVPAAAQDVDVLHYGTLNERRATILRELNKRCRVKHLEGVYGEARDGWIARSKVVVSIHYYEAKIAEQVRISYLLNNRKAVVAEASEGEPFAGLVGVAAYEQLVETCMELVRDEGQREALAERGYAGFRERAMVEYLRGVAG